MGNIGQSLIDQLKWFGFKHEAKKFLIWFGFKDDRFSIESIVKKNFVWSKVSEAFVSEDETVVDVTDVSDKQVVVGKELMKGGGPDLFADGNHRQT